MKKSFNKLMREQLQERFNKLESLKDITPPKQGWLKTIREALGMPGAAFARLMNCSRINAFNIEKREQSGTVTLNTLETAAAALNCKLVYALIPIKSLDETLENQARKVAKQQIKEVDNSMSLEEQGLTFKQLKEQEDALVQELLQDNIKALWSKDEV